jgi:hypothetical protein
VRIFYASAARAKAIPTQAQASEQRQQVTITGVFLNRQDAKAAKKKEDDPQISQITQI